MAVTYRFHSVWTVQAERDAVYEALVDYERYPQWWPQFRHTEMQGDGCLTVCKSYLPYALTFTMYDDGRDDRSGILAGRMTGDIEGTARWTVVSTAPGSSRIVYDQDVVVHLTALKLISPVARPVLRLNHRLMMEGGQRGLRQKLEAPTGA